VVDHGAPGVAGDHGLEVVHGLVEELAVRDIPHLERNPVEVADQLRRCREQPAAHRGRQRSPPHGDVASGRRVREQFTHGVGPGIHELLDLRGRQVDQLLEQLDAAQRCHLQIGSEAGLRSELRWSGPEVGSRPEIWHWADERSGGWNGEQRRFERRG
jgi:hypothetical protein